jgi:carbamate kinase
VIATDVDNAILGFGTPEARPLGTVTAAELQAHADAGEFTSGSMGPKVAAVLRFVAAGGRLGSITSLSLIAEAVAGRAGTVVTGNA